MNLFLHYPKCSTCKKAKAFLDNLDIKYISRDITIKNPSKEELSLWHENSGVELKKFFNTSGILYREFGLKDKIKDMTQDEMLTLLATDGKLIKRPLLITTDKVLIGFKEDVYNNLK